MPVHDWSRVDANLFHDFHQTWTIGIRNALNGGLLPKGYSALVGQRSGGLLPDVLALDEISAARANRIAIRHPLGEVVSVIEIVSPGNKSSRRALRAFVEKTVGFLEHGVQVLVVDLFPPSVRDPNGIHKAIWDEFQDEPFRLPPETPLTLAAYAATISKRAYVELLAVGDRLPDMPAFLDDDHYVPVPLGATYESTWESCPDDMRAFVEGRDLA